MDSDVFIRNATIFDATSINEIRNYYIRNTNYNFEQKEEDVKLTLSNIQNHIDQGYPFIVAVNQDTVIGYASLSRYRNNSGYNKTAELSVYLKNEYKGNGLGYTLADTVLQQGKILGFNCIVSYISSENVQSIYLHEKLGFTLCGVIKDVGYKNNDYRDVTILQKLLK